MTTMRSLVVFGAALAGLGGTVMHLDAANATEYTSDIGAFIGERVTSEQREKAAVLIASELAGAGIEAERRKYNTGNVHWSLDLVMPPMQGTNVVAEIAATEHAEQTIVIGAHYDSVRGSPGADDNASGTYAAIELAKRVAAMPRRKMNVVFVWFDQEEENLVGSKVFAEQWQQSGRSMHSMHNLDMIGYDGNGDGRFDLDVPDGELADLYLEEAKRIGIPIARDTFTSTDHESFRQLGYRAVCLSEDFSNKDVNPDYHKRGDTKIDEAYMQSGIELVSSVLARLVSQ